MVIIKKYLLSIANKFKPVLTAILPIEWLRKVKKKIILSSISALNQNNYLAFHRNSNLDGVNLIGFIRAEIGLGQSCRLVADALDQITLPFTIYNYVQVSAMRFSDSNWDTKITNTVPHNINILHINPYEMPLAFLQLGKEVWDKRYNIGFWLWELEEFPKDWLPSLDLVDEIWTPSDFAGLAVRKVTDKPVRTIPYPLSAPVEMEFDRSFFNLPENKFLFLCMYDCNSTIERKNPIGAIHAYKKAFSSELENCGLVVKVNNPQKKDLDLLNNELSGYKNVWLITNILSKTQVNSLIKSVDAFVSLHRAEGFGLPPAEAMLLGTPCIATNWSSNTEFMNHEVGCMIGYDFTIIENDIGPYKAGNRWADPHIDEAAASMKRLFEDPVYTKNLAEKAQTYIEKRLSMERTVGIINMRITEIYKEQLEKEKK